MKRLLGLLLIILLAVLVIEKYNLWSTYKKEEIIINNIKKEDNIWPHLKSINEDLVIAHVTEGGSLHMVLTARNGRGYYTCEQNKVLHPNLQLGVIATDSNYSPVRKANYTVEGTRVGHDSKYDELTLEVWTDGSVTPQDAVVMSAQILIAHFEKFLGLVEVTRDINIEKDEEVVVENEYEKAISYFFRSDSYGHYCKCADSQWRI